MLKNVAAQNVSATLLSTGGAPVDTGTTTVYVTGDNGTRTAGVGVVTNKGGGDWNYSPTSDETNYEHIKFTFTNPGAFPVGINVYTLPANIWSVFDLNWATAWDDVANRWHIINTNVGDNLERVYDIQFNDAYDETYRVWRTGDAIFGIITGSPTQTQIQCGEFTANNPEAYVGGMVIIGGTSATAPHAIGKVTAFDPATDTATVTGLYAAPQNSDPLIFLFPPK